MARSLAAVLAMRLPQIPLSPRQRTLLLARRALGPLSLLLLLASIVAFGLFYSYVLAGLPDVADLASLGTTETTRILSRDGKVVATLFEENRTLVPLDKISPTLVEALIAIEDSRFRLHHGVDWIGVARAAAVNVLRSGIDQGASTLTMQLARNRFLSRRQNYTRKLKEMVLALRIERRYSKDKILEYYLNNVYFGGGAYGAAAAARVYFNRRPADLSVAQAALIAGLVQAPSALDPFVNPEGALKRMGLVLNRMRELDLLDEPTYRKALDEGTRLRFGSAGHSAGGNGGMLQYPYFTSYVVAQLSKRYSKDALYRGGLRVATTLDVKLQKICEEELSSTLAQMGPGAHASNGAAVLIDNRTGVVRAMVGGTHWSTHNQLNRAWQAVRQPGSAFKPIVYAAALLGGMTEETVVPDRPVTVGGWTPKNSDGRYLGDIPLRTGLQLSRNPVSAQLVQSVGPREVVRLAQAMGIAEKLPAIPSLALGAGEVSPLSLASAYATIASGGLRRESAVIASVTDTNGHIDQPPNPGLRILATDVAAMLTEMMMRVVERGTGKAAALGKVPVAGKTGTTDDSRDAWFAGFTPDYTLAVWIGNDDHSRMYGVYGGGIPALVWRRIMSRVPASKTDFDVFAGQKAQKVELCSVSTQLAGPGCPHYTETFRCGFLPTVSCPLHARPATPAAHAAPDEAPPETDAPSEMETDPTPDEVAPPTPAPEKTEDAPPEAPPATPLPTPQGE